MPNVDVIMSVFGSMETVKNCIDSLYPLPESWNLYVYENVCSELDGTHEYLIQSQKNFGFKLISEKINVTHGNAILKLVNGSSSQWILHLDSDSKLLDRKFYDIINSSLTKEKFKVWGRVDPTFNIPNVKRDSIKLIRAHAWNILFERDFFINNQISPMPFLKKFNVSHKNDSLRNVHIIGDTLWHLYWESTRQDLFGRYTDEMWECWIHLNHASCDFRDKNKIHIKFTN